MTSRANPEQGFVFAKNCVKKIGKSKLRIIGGTWRGRRLEFLDLPQVRPTPERVRETLFNWLSPDIGNAVCLDLFAGSGALSFEAVSRGAAYVMAVETDRRICAQIRTERQRFNTAAIEVFCRHAEQFVADLDTKCDVIFVDPPFGQNLVIGTLVLLAGSTCVQSNRTLVYVEYEAGISASVISALDGGKERFQVLRQSRAAQVGCTLLKCV